MRLAVAPLPQRCLDAPCSAMSERAFFFLACLPGLKLVVRFFATQWQPRAAVQVWCPRACALIAEDHRSDADRADHGVGGANGSVVALVVLNSTQLY